MNKPWLATVQLTRTITEIALVELNEDGTLSKIREIQDQLDSEVHEIDIIQTHITHDE